MVLTIITGKNYTSLTPGVSTRNPIDCISFNYQKSNETQCDTEIITNLWAKDTAERNCIWEQCRKKEQNNTWETNVEENLKKEGISKEINGWWEDIQKAITKVAINYKKESENRKHSREQEHL